MKNIVDIEQAKSKFTFFISDGKTEKYFCKCGEEFETEATMPQEFLNDSDDDELKVAVGDISISMREEFRCPHCNTNYKIQNNLKLIIPQGQYFSAKYDFENTEEYCCLYFGEIKPIIADGNTIDFYEKVKEIKVSKKDKTITFTNEGNVFDVDINNSISVIENFFRPESKMVSNIYALHLFAAELSKIITDANGVNVSEILDKIMFEQNSDVIFNLWKKIFVSFFSIIKLDNLSTIALTKDFIFLYDLIKESNPPSAKVIKEAKVTSPLKIFNFLAKNYIKTVNEEISLDKSFNWETSVRAIVAGKEVDLKIKDISAAKGTLTKTEKGSYDVFTFSSEGEISKSIYNKLENFYEYKQLMKYAKHIKNEEIIDLLAKYDYQLIVNMIDLIYYRDGITMDEIKRMIPLFVDHCKTNSSLQENINYKTLSKFDFGFYDDCLMMLKTLEFDPRKEFYKIKTNSELKDFHDQVVKYYNAIRMEEDQGYKAFFDKFKFIEEPAQDQDGEIVPIKVQLLDTPTKVVQEGRDMHHSAGSYVKRVMDGEYILLSINDHSVGLSASELTRFTMSFVFNAEGKLEFDQIKSYSNKLGSTRFRMLIRKWMECKNLNFNENRPDIKINVLD